MRFYMQRLGIAKGTIYHYFSSKEEVLDAVLENTTSVWQLHMQGVFDSLTFLTDVGIYPWSESKMERRIRALPALIEQQMGAPKRSIYSYGFEIISCKTLSTTTGVKRYVKVGSEPYFPRTKAFHSSVYSISAACRDCQR